MPFTRWLRRSTRDSPSARYLTGSHTGVILLRAQEERPRIYVELAAVALEQLKLDEITGTVVEVIHRGVRIRRAPLK